MALFRPGSEPIEALAAALDETLGRQPDRAQQLRKSTQELLNSTRKGRGHNENLLLVVDQFEEIFRFQRDDDGRFALDADSAYKLEVLSYVLLMSSAPSAHQDVVDDSKDVVEEAKLAMAVDEKVIAPLVGESSIVSRYDDHMLSFRTLTTPGAISTHVRLSVQREDKTGTTFFPHFPNIDLDFSVRFSKWQWLSAALGSFSLAFGWSVAPKYSDVLAKLLQAAGVLFFSAPGKDFYGFWANRMIKSHPIKELVAALRGVRSASTRAAPPERHEDP